MESNKERLKIMCNFSTDILEGEAEHVKNKINELMEKYDGSVDAVVKDLLKQKYLVSTQITYNDRNLFDQIDSTVQQNEKDGYIVYSKLYILVDKSEDPAFLKDIMFGISYR